MKVVTVKEMTVVYTGIAQALGATPEEAEIFAHCHVRADLRGMYTQGAAIIPYTVWLTEQGLARFGAPFDDPARRGRAGFSRRRLWRRGRRRDPSNGPGDGESPQGRHRQCLGAAWGRLQYDRQPCLTGGRA